MQANNHIYFFNYDNNESELCKLESKYIFNKEEKDKLLFSDVKTDPSRSAYIKKRLDIILCSADYDSLIQQIKEKEIRAKGFKVEYLVLEGDPNRYAERLQKMRDIGFSIEGFPDYYKPTIIYALCYCDGIWYFGVLHKNNLAWHQHQQKPYSYSNSININIAKALVNIAAKNNKETKLLDACCGVGTIMLEACFAGNHIEGCDINEKICPQARGNLSHFNYTATVHCSDIAAISNSYDTAIIDLPYNLYSWADEDTILHILNSTAEIADQLLIVSATDIKDYLARIGLNILDHCEVSKIGKCNFTREVWVCGK